VAAELLVPAQVLKERWGTLNYLDLARDFCVSGLVILVRAYEMGLLERQEFQKLYAESKQKIKINSEYEKSSTGGDFYRTFQVRNGRLLVSEAAQALREGSLLYREAAILLNASPETLEKALESL
jgi:Zn-dependent peptidase ImmA (M78 family)